MKQQTNNDSHHKFHR